MLFSKQLTIGKRKVSFVGEVFCKRVRIQALLRFSYIIKLSMFRRESYLLIFIVFLYSELCPEAQFFQYEPLENEVIGESESCRLVIIVQVCIPQRIGDRIVINIL